MAKKASEVAAVSARKADFSSVERKIITSEKSARPWLIAQKPIRMIIRRPESSTQVSTTFAFTLSPTPRKLTRDQRHEAERQHEDAGRAGLEAEAEAVATGSPRRRWTPWRPR